MTRISALVLSILFPLGAAPADDWATFRGDALRSGNPGGSPLPAQLDLGWRFQDTAYRSPSFDSSPAVAGGAVIVGLAELSVFSPSGRIVSLDAASGKRLWDFKTKYPVFSSPAIAGGRVYVGEGHHQDSECRLYCLDAASGKEHWTFPTKSHVESTPAVDDQRIYFGAGDDGVHCVGAKDGKPIWHFENEHVDISPLVTSGLVFTGTGYGSASALCLSAKDGTVRWKTPLDLSCWGSPVRVGNRIYFGLGNGTFVQSAGAPRGAVVCLAATSGAKVWQKDLPDAVLTAIAFGGGKLFCGSRDGRLYALEPNSGDIIWKTDLGSPVVASPLVGSRAVAAIGSAGRLFLASPERGEVLGVFDLGKLLEVEARWLSSPAIASGRIVVCGGGSILSLGPRQGEEGEGGKRP